MTESKPRGTDVSQLVRQYRTANSEEFPESLDLRLTKEQELKYGENPNQAAAMYRLSGTSMAEATNIRLAKTGKGGLSATNFMDVTRAMDVLKFFPSPSVAVMKHLIPSGFATQTYAFGNLTTLYESARDADARSAFGSVVVFNRPVDKATAEALTSTYVEGVAAPGYESGVMEIFEKKKDMRIMLFDNLDKLPKFVGDDNKGIYDIKALPTGRVLVQKPYLSSIRSIKDLVLDPMVKDGDLTYIVERDPTPRELDDLLTAWYVNIGVRSNGIVLVKDGITVAVGSGQQERVGAVEQAIVKAIQKAMDREGIEYNAIDGIYNGLKQLKINPVKGAALSSDAFFPFRDCIDLMGSIEISAVIQPGGSKRDFESILAANKYNMAMAFTGERCFAHF